MADFYGAGHRFLTTFRLSFVSPSPGSPPLPFTGRGPVFQDSSAYVAPNGHFAAGAASLVFGHVADMKTRTEWEAEQNLILASCDEVREELGRIPGVVEVGVGLRHRAGSLVEEAVFVVAVEPWPRAATAPPGSATPSPTSPAVTPP